MCGIPKIAQESVRLFANVPFMQHSQPLLSASDAFQHLKTCFIWDQEEVHIVALNPQKFVIETGLLFRGTVDYCLFHPRDVFRFLIKANASSFILAHNHPSGQPEPSEADIIMTQRLYKLSQMMEIEFVDHLILTLSGYKSLKEMKCLGLTRSARRRIK